MIPNGTRPPPSGAHSERSEMRTNATRTNQLGRVDAAALAPAALVAAGMAALAFTLAPLAATIGHALAALRFTIGG